MGWKQHPSCSFVTACDTLSPVCAAAILDMNGQGRPGRSGREALHQVLDRARRGRGTLWGLLHRGAACWAAPLAACGREASVGLIAERQARARTLSPATRARTGWALHARARTATEGRRGRNGKRQTNEEVEQLQQEGWEDEERDGGGGRTRACCGGARFGRALRCRCAAPAHRRTPRFGRTAREPMGGMGHARKTVGVDAVVRASS